MSVIAGNGLNKYVDTNLAFEFHLLFILPSRKTPISSMLSFRHAQYLTDYSHCRANTTSPGVSCLLYHSIPLAIKISKSINRGNPSTHCRFCTRMKERTIPPQLYAPR